MPFQGAWSPRVTAWRLGPLAAALVLVTASCHPRPGTLFVPPPERTVRAGFAELWRGVTSLRGEASVSLTVDGDSYPGKLALAMRKPGLVRADFFDYFGSLKGLIILAGENVIRILPGGDAPAGTSPELMILDRLSQLGGDSPNEELAALMVGLPGAFAGRLPFNRPEGPEAGDARGGTTLMPFGDRPVLGRVVLRDARTGESVTMAYEGYAMNGDVPLPRRVTVEAPARKWRLEITWKRVELNADIEHGLFETELPD